MVLVRELFCRVSLISSSNLTMRMVRPSLCFSGSRAKRPPSLFRFETRVTKHRFFICRALSSFAFLRFGFSCQTFICHMSGYISRSVSKRQDSCSSWLGITFMLRRRGNLEHAFLHLILPLLPQRLSRARTDRLIVVPNTRATGNHSDESVLVV